MSWFDFDLSDIIDSAVDTAGSAANSLGNAISYGFNNLDSLVSDSLSSFSVPNWSSDWYGVFDEPSSYGSAFSGGFDNLPVETSYSDLAGLPTTGLDLGSILGSASNGIDKVANYMNTPGGKLVTSLGAAGISALDAMKRNDQMKKAYKKQQELLAARQAQNLKYDAPLHLTMDRTAVASPEARRGESAFFTNNRLPSYLAEGGGVRATQPSVLGFIQYLMSGNKLPAELEEEKRRLRAGKEGTMMEGAAKIRTRREQLEEQERQQCLAKGGSPHYIKGPTAGQDDKVDAQLSDGEYVFDADVVSALGDGNNEAGALKLDQMRENVRQHKRSAPKSKIPPKAKSPLAYMKPKGAK